jgi:VanZ family protein
MRPVTKISIFGIRLAVAVLAVYWLALFVGTHLPTALDLSPRINDKIKHFSAFFLLGGLLCYITNSPRSLRRFSTIGLVGMAYAGLDEFTQQFVPGRYPDTLDFVADSAGLWTAIVLYVAAKWLAARSGRFELGGEV